MQFFFGKRRKFNRTKEKGSQVGVYPNYWFSTSPTIVGPTTRLQSQPSVFWNKSNNRFESWTEITDPWELEIERWLCILGFPEILQRLIMMISIKKGKKWLGNLYSNLSNNIINHCFSPLHEVTLAVRRPPRPRTAVVIGTLEASTAALNWDSALEPYAAATSILSERICRRGKIYSFAVF